MSYSELYEKLNNYQKSQKHAKLDKKGNPCCNDPFIIKNPETKELVCTSCGDIASKDEIVLDSEITNTHDFLNVGRENTSLLLPRSSIITFIKGFSSQYRNLKQLHLYHRPTEERGLFEVFKKIDELFLKIKKLPKKIKIDVKYYYKLLCEDNDDGSLTRGDIRIGVILSCIYIASKNNEIPLTIDEIGRLCNIDKSIITKGLKRINNIEKAKNIKLIQDEDNIHQYIYKYSRKIDISQNDTLKIHLLYERANRLNIIKNNTYKTICIGLLYLFIEHYKIDINKKKISECFSISQVTLIKIFNIYKEYEDILFIGLD